MGKINIFRIFKVYKAAKQLFDNRLGWSAGRNPYAPRYFWVNLAIALYGKNDKRVDELKNDS